MFYWKEIDDLLESRPLVKTYLRKFVGKKLILFFSTGGTKLYETLYSYITLCKSDLSLCLKPGFHMIVRIVPIAPLVSRYLETIRTTGAISSLHMIVSIASKARDAGSSAMSLGQTIEFLRLF